MVEAKDIMSIEDYRLELMDSNSSKKPKTQKDKRKLEKIREHDEFMKRLGLYEE